MRELLSTCGNNKLYELVNIPIYGGLVMPPAGQDRKNESRTREPQLTTWYKLQICRDEWRM